MLGAGAYQVRKQRAGPEAVNACSIGELLAGFFDFYAPVLTDWAAGRNSSWRASTFWGDWKEAPWYPAKNYIFSIEDPFNAGEPMQLPGLSGQSAALSGQRGRV